MISALLLSLGLSLAQAQAPTVAGINASASATSSVVSSTITCSGGTANVGNGALFVACSAPQKVGVSTGSPQSTLDVNGSAQFGLAPTVSTFAATGSLLMVARSTISAPGGITITTDTVASALSTPNVFISSIGMVQINSGIQVVDISSTILTAPGLKSQAPFIVTKSTFNVSGGLLQRQSLYEFSGPNANMLMATFVEGTMVGPTINIILGSGTLQQPAEPASIANNLTIGGINLKMHDGHVLRTIDNINFLMDTANVSSTSMNTAIVFNNTTSGAVTVSEKCRLTSTGTFSCGSAAPLNTMIERIYAFGANASSAEGNPLALGCSSMGTGTNDKCSLTFRNQSHVASASMTLVFTNVNAAYDLAFGLTTNSGATPFESLRFKGDGTVGMGVTAAGAHLHISSAAAAGSGAAAPGTVSLLVDGDAATALKIGVSSLTLTSSNLTVWGSTLTVAATGIVTIPSQPHADVTCESTCVISNSGVAQFVFWDTNGDVNNGMHSASVSSETVTVPAGGGGRYVVNASFYIGQPSAAAAYTIQVLKNATVVCTNEIIGSAVASLVLKCSKTITLAATDTIKVKIINNGLATIQGASGSGNTYLTVDKVQ